jgi:hypothetical protein
MPAGVTSSIAISRRWTAAAIYPLAMPPWALAPDVYISHYPLNEISQSAQEFRGYCTPGGTKQRRRTAFCPICNRKMAAWCPPDKRIQFRRYNPTALRAFWQRYRQDATYNLTRRNCSTTVIQALDSALEGVLGR